MRGDGMWCGRGVVSVVELLLAFLPECPLQSG